MIRWILERNWLSSASLSVFGILFFGGLDLIAQGPNALLVTSMLSLSVLFATRIPALAVSLIAVGTAIEIYFGLLPVAGGAAVAVCVFLFAAFTSRVWYFVCLTVSVVSGVAVAWANSFALPTNTDVYGLYFRTDTAKITAFILMAALVGLSNTLAWLFGRLAMTNETYVGTEFDRALSAETQAKLSLEVAEQNERFAIARDINELIIQKITAVISQAEGGTYAAKADPSSAIRSLEKVGTSARAAHAELRRLFDMLNKTHEVSAAPPGIDELDALVVAYREFGYSVRLNHEGQRFEISEGAGLAIHRIIFDALENVRKHCEQGTDVSIDFSWVPDGMQVLVKDNGIETKRRNSIEGLDSSYTAEDDVRALVETIKGAGLTAMKERAALYGGSIEATRVPGVGFTVSAIFPHLRALAGI